MCGGVGRIRDAREACAACRRGFVGGWLLRRWKSAKTVFQKSELASLKQRTFEKQRRFPPPKKRSPPAESGDRQHTPHGRTSHAPHLPTKKEQRRTSNPPLFSKHHPISISPSAQQSSLSIPAHSSADPPPS